MSFISAFTYLLGTYIGPRSLGAKALKLDSVSSKAESARDLA